MLLAAPSVLLDRLHTWATSGNPAFRYYLLHFPLWRGCHLTFFWMLATSISMIILSDSTVAVLYPSTDNPPQIYYWEITSHGVTVIVAFSFLYSYMWRRTGLALLTFYWLLAASTFHLLLLLNDKQTGNYPNVVLVHGLVSAQYFYMALGVVSWVQLQNFIDKLRAGSSGELDDFDEQELEELSVESREVRGWSSQVAGLSGQRDQMVEARVLSLGRVEVVGRGEVEYYNQLYWSQHCFGDYEG
jgi:hypothetical protein